MLRSLLLLEMPIGRLVGELVVLELIVAEYASIRSSYMGMDWGGKRERRGGLVR